MKTLYGKPETKEKPYVRDFYCAICNKIPYIEVFNRSTEKREEIEILALEPIPTVMMFQGKPEQVLLMVCPGCMNRLDKQIRDKIRENLKTRRIWPRDIGDDDQGGGGVPAR